MKGHPMLPAVARLLLAALLALPAWAVAATVEYIHTDALGSPVAVTNASGQVIERREYEPYGRQLLPATLANGPGYTGHVTDAATGLTYMQQRYYDPTLGRFLSVDPVTAYGGDSRFFNRYAYAFNSPYAFKDSDGRCPICVGILIGAAAGFITDYIAQRKLHPDRPVNRKQLAISTLGGMATGGTGAAAVSAVRVGVVTVGEAVAVQTAASGVVGAASAHANAAANGQSATAGEVAASAAGSVVGSLAGSAIGVAAGDFAGAAAEGTLQRMASSSAPGLPSIASTTASTGTAIPTQSALQAGASQAGQIAAGAAVQVKQEQMMQPKVQDPERVP